MSFLKLKFLSFACLSLTFLTNTMANCVDLTGTYQCPIEKIELAYSVSQQGVPTYFLKNDKGVQTLIANANDKLPLNSPFPHTFCDEEGMAFTVAHSFSSALIQAFNLSENRDKLTITIASFKSDETSEHITDYSCERI